AVISAMAKLQGQSTSNPTSIVQKAAVAALTGSQQCVEEMKAGYIQLRDRVVAGLRAIPGITCSKREGAFYAYPNVSAFFDGKSLRSGNDLVERLMNEVHVVAVAGQGFGNKERIRLSYATSMKQIDKALER